MNKKNVLLVEDDFLNRRVVKKVLLENDYCVLEAKNSSEAIAILLKENVDLAVLDINLGEGQPDGISLGNKIKTEHKIPFIYLTSYENLEVINKAVSTSPYSYLTKPFKNVDLITAMELAFRKFELDNSQVEILLVKDQDYYIELPISQIDFIEAEGNYLLIHSASKSYKNRSTLKQILEQLPNEQFVQIHRAYVVNREKIEKFNNKNVVVKGKSLPISRNYVEDFKFS